MAGVASLDKLALDKAGRSRKLARVCLLAGYTGWGPRSAIENPNQ